MAAAIRDVIAAFAFNQALSPQETIVLTYAASGLHRKECAFRVGCSHGTVDTYWRRIFRKTGKHSQAEVFLAIIWFVVSGERSLTESEALPRDAR